jgi:class 3 adenylate cyclase
MTLIKKQAIAQLEQEKKDARQRNIRNSILAGLGVMFVFSFVVYRQRNKIKKGKKRSDELLLNILPSEVAEELKQKGSTEAKQFDEVTVMFTDFKNFTQISEKLSPSELVSEIDNCCKAFDNIITNHNIEKIKTIGDSYMCAGALPVPNKTNATDVVSAAIGIQQYMYNYSQNRIKEGKEILEIRIGVHTGAVVAGVVGIKKFAYDIWGDTVNIASRMESSGEAGKIKISASTYELVKDKFTCTYRGKIHAKNKGEIDMYFVGSIS